jgi:hypothetical protein
MEIADFLRTVPTAEWHAVDPRYVALWSPGVRSGSPLCYTF